MNIAQAIFEPDEEDQKELEALATVAPAILGTDPIAQAHYEAYLADPYATTQSLLLDELLFAWEAFQRMDQICRSAASAEIAYLATAGRARDPRMGLVCTLPLRATMALVNFRTVHPLSDAELAPILAAIEDDARLGQAQAFVAVAFADGAPTLAARLHDLALAQAKADGQTAEDAERTALGVYTRAMPGGQTQADIAATREGYSMMLPIDLEGGAVDVPVRTPYHISSRLDGRPCPIVEYRESDVRAGDAAAIARKKVAYGKGSSEEIRSVMVDLLAADAAGVRSGAVAAAKGKSADAAASAAGAFVEQWMSDHDVGVDCSGFVFEATAQSDDGVGAGWQGRADGSLDAISMNGANVAAHKDPENSEEIPVSAARPGDLAINASVHHIGVVEAPAVHRPVSEVDASQRTIRNLLRIREDQEPQTCVWEVGIAHSTDKTAGQGGTDLPGPHLATYWFSEAGVRLTQDEDKDVMAKFSSFHRPLLAPPVRNSQDST